MAAARASWSVAHSLLPRRRIFGGGIMETELDWFAPVVRRRLHAVTQFSKGAVDMVCARLGNDAGRVGAAALPRAQERWVPLAFAGLR